jgi:RNA polymerase sigma-70 factor, ECF subfamily
VSIASPFAVAGPEWLTADGLVDVAPGPSHGPAPCEHVARSVESDLGNTAARSEGTALTAGRSEGDQASIERPEVKRGRDDALLAALRRGDEHAFATLVRAHHAALVRLARTSVASDAVAQEVAQETWLAVIEGITRFEGRSSLKTWIFSILVNKARTRGVRDKRVVPMSSLGGQSAGAPAVDPDRFVREGERWGGHWSQPPTPWTQEPAARVLARETMAVTARAITQLPERQRTVITLRDLQGWTSEETCALLQLSEGNQRVLLHRARSQVRSVLEEHFGVES